jgi:hypothetical protein
LVGSDIQQLGLGPNKSLENQELANTSLIQWLENTFMVEHTLTLGLVLPLKNIFNVRNEFFS